MCNTIYTLQQSARCPRRFALGCPDGPVLGNGRAVTLRRGRQWLDGYVEASGSVWWFIPEQNDESWWWLRRIKLRTGMKIWL